ncbi:stage II sporulation protein P [Oscillospiraceae bacterium MB08-C2-2]|nr:stage II sporulation protein P [Oscillospiraceae bacterium MB08-C2-2]
MKSRLKQTGSSAMPVIMGFLLCISILAGTLRMHEYSLSDLGEKAAVFSALLSMSEAGLDVLRERFQDQLLPTVPVPDHPYTARPAQPQPQEPEASSLPNASNSDSATEFLPTEDNPPPVPTQYADLLLAEDFGGGPDKGLAKYGSAYIKNETKNSAEAVEKLLMQDFPIAFEDTEEPQVLIFHTHATESFEPYDRDEYDTRNTWRSVNDERNMVAVGNAFVQVLEENGIGVLHDTTQHDYPSYNGSYERSRVTIQQYLEEYPSIKVVLDLHRDAIQREGGEIVKPVAEIDGQKAAQIMIISACDDGTMDIPEWKQNFRFAAEYQNYMESAYPGLTRPVYFCYRKYNMDLSTGSLLLEFGSNANTLEEAVYSAQLSAQALADLIHDNVLSF